MPFEALLRYGSTLSPRTARGDSVSDLIAVVAELPAALVELGHPHLAKWRLIPPVTVAHEGAKLSLITRAEATRELGARHDLYLAGRLSKKIEVLHGDVEALVEAAVSTVVEVSALDWPRRISVEDAVIRCLAISYRAEVRPEGGEKVRRLFEAFADFYWRRLAPRVEAHARGRGLVVQNGDWIDRRTEAVRLHEQAQLAGILSRSRRRALMRWPQQLLIFDGSLGYVLGKLRRSWT